MTPIPTIAQLRASILADLQTEFGTVNVLGKAFLYALSIVLAAALKLFYLTLGELQKNIFPDTAISESKGGTLERFGRVMLGRDPYPASQGQYTLTVTGTTGSLIPAGTTWKADDDSMNPGVLYVVDADYTTVADTDTIPVRALTAGSVGRLGIGNTLTATAPIIGIDDTATYATETFVPADAEDLEIYRQLVVERFRLYPQGGASADYRIWGRDAAGVQQIYPYSAAGVPGGVNVFVEATIADSTDGMGTPNGTILSAVEDAIETDPITGDGRRPLQASVNVQAVSVNKIDITIDGAATISAADRTLIDTALEEAINAVRPYIAGADVLADRNDNFGVNSVINVALSTVPGSIFSTVSMTYTIAADPPVSFTTRTFTTGNIPFLTSVTFNN